MIVVFDRNNVSRGGYYNYHLITSHYCKTSRRKKETASGQINICQTLELQRSMNNSLSLSLPLLEFNMIQQMHKMSFNQ